MQISSQDLLSQEVYRAAFDAGPVAICVFDPASLEILGFNEAMVDRYGYTETELSGMNVMHLHLPDEIPGLIAELAALRGRARTPEPRLNRAFRHRRKDGRVLDIEVTLTLVAAPGRPQVVAVMEDVTERRTAEEALWEAEHRLRTVIQSAPIVLWTVDREGVFTLSLGRGLRALGLKAGEVVGQSIYALYPDSPVVRDSVHRALAGESLTAMVPLGDGWFDVLFAPLRGGHNEIVGAIGVASDVTDRVTERRRAQTVQRALYRIAEAAASVSDLHALFARIHESVGELMPARNFYIALYDEPTLTVSFPYFSDEHDAPPSPRTLGRGLTDYVLRTGQPLLISSDGLTELCRRGELEPQGSPPVDWLGVPLHVDGRNIGVLAVQSYAAEVRYGDADCSLLVFVSRTVAQVIARAQAHEALRQSEARKSAILAAALDGVVSVDADGRLTEFNAAAERIFGRSRAEVLGKPMVEMIVPPELRERHRLGLARVLATGRSALLGERMETLALRADGTRFPVELTIAAIRVPGERPAFTAFVRDLATARPAARRI